ncbi:MAG: hypothetical protein HY245_13240 [Rhizobiales bacterium]|nr:hypothetical protein [Hyphomicrobiales bacterium]MBI3674355.1 hypothetical protein [Hyphomicrobiales bacterium]
MDKFRVAVPVMLMGLAWGGWARAQQACVDVMKLPEGPEVAAFVAQQDLCKGFKRKLKVAGIKINIAMDRTADVRLEALRICLGQSVQTLTATIELTCSSSEGSDLQGNLTETFDITAAVQASTCTIEELQVNPRGDLGKFIGKMVDLSDRLRPKLQEPVTKYCRK